MSPQYRTLILTAVLTGLRRGELLGLQWGDIDGRHNQIHVRRAFCNVSKELIRRKQGGQREKLDMSPTLVKELKALLMASGTRSATALIFTEADGSPIDPDNFYHREFVPALQRRNSGGGVHSLRHTKMYRFGWSRVRASCISHAKSATHLQRRRSTLTDICSRG